MNIQKINSYSELEKQFFNYIQNYEGSYTCNNDMKRWMERNKKLKQIDSKQKFRKVMKSCPDIYPDEYYKLKRSYKHFLEEVILHLAEPTTTQKLE